MGERRAFDRELTRLAVVVVLGGMMAILDSTIVNVAVATIGRGFHATLSTVQWVLTAYSLALAMTVPITTWAMRRFGGRTMWLVSLGLFIAGSMLCGTAWSVTSLIVFRVVQAVGGGMLGPVGQTMLAREAGPARMGRVMSAVAVPAMLGPVLGPVLGGLIVDDLSWRWMFFVNVPLCAAALLAAVRWLPRDTDREAGSRLDALGLVLLSPGLAALVYGLSQSANGRGVTDPRVYAFAAGGAVLVGLFAAVALRKGDRALVDLRLFRDRGFTASVAALFVYSGAVFGVLFMCPVYFQTVRGESPLHAGVLLSPLGLGAMISMPLAGRLTDRLGPHPLAIAGLAIALTGVSFYTRLDADTNEVVLAAAIFVLGLGHGLMIPPLMSAAYQRLRKAAIPAATTASGIMVRVGSSFGGAALALALQAFIRQEVPGASGTVASAVRFGPAALARAFGDGFWLAAGLAAVALVPILLIPRRGSVVEADGAVAEPVDHHA